MHHHRVTRRQLLRAGAGIGAAGAGAAAIVAATRGGGGTAGPATSAARPPAAAPPAPPAMLKGISLQGLANVYSDGYGVRPYLLGGERPTEVVTIWINWSHVQPTRPEPFTREQSLAELSGAPGEPAAARGTVDQQIALANADGRRVSLCVYQSFPSWTHPSVGPLDPARDPDQGGRGHPGQDGLANDARMPDDLTASGPWAWFVEWLCARYADTGGEPTPGPGVEGATVGNPSGARIEWLQPMNEPNLVWWPQASPAYPAGTMASAVAELARTAAAVCEPYHRGDAPARGPGLLVPNTADVVDERSRRGTPWRPFTEELLGHLAGWRPAVPVGWAQHSYHDVKYGPGPDGRWNAEIAVELLRAAGWPDPAAWITEGGYQFGVRRASPRPNHFVVDPAKRADPAAFSDAYAEQAARLAAHWEAMSALPVRLLTQYQVNDFDERFQSSLRGPLRPGADGAGVPHEPPYPAYGLWPTLGA